MKRSKFIYIIGSIIIGVTALLIVFFGLIAGGVINATQTKLVFASATEEFTYDGKAHKDTEWTLVDGKLKDGHTPQRSPFRAVRPTSVRAKTLFPRSLSTATARTLRSITR